MKLKDSVIGLLSMAALAVLAASCNASYPGQVFEPDPDKVPTNKEDTTLKYVPINIYTKDPGYFSLITRGTGAFDEGDVEKRWRDPNFYIFAFRVGTGPDGTGGQSNISEAPDLRRSVYADGKNDENEIKYNISCLLDGTSYNLGMPFHFLSPDNLNGVPGQLEPVNVDPEDPNHKRKMTYYYSAGHQDVGYNFFGYHIDDFVPNSSNTHREADKIWYDIDLDGYRDIILGYADSLKAEDFTSSGKYAEVKTLTDEDKAKILSMYGGYSTYSGHRNIYPVIDMHHQMARVRFRAYAADKSATDVTITKIAVNAAAKAEMVVAGRRYNSQTMKYGDERKDFFVSELPAEVGQPYPGHLRPEGYGFEWIANKTEYEDQREENAQNIQDIGASLLLAPSSEYVVKITFQYRVKQNGGGYKTMERTALYRIKPSENDSHSYDEATRQYMFKAGVYYTIDIAVWGLQKLELSGSVKGWETGGGIEIDPDKEQ